MSERTNEEWLADLRGPDKDQAITDLRQILMRGLSYSLSSRTRGDIEALVEDSEGGDQGALGLDECIARLRDEAVRKPSPVH